MVLLCYPLKGFTTFSTVRINYKTYIELECVLSLYAAVKRYFSQYHWYFPCRQENRADAMFGLCFELKVID